VNTDSLESLLCKMRAGDLEAAEEMFRAYEPELRRLVRRRLSNRLRAKFDSLDVVQSVWVRVLHDFRAGGRDIAGAAHLRNFLVRVARNCLTDRLRHFREALERERPLGGDAGNNPSAAPQPRPSEEARANELWETMLDNCPPEHHDVLRLKRQGLPLAAIAGRTGLHEDSVRRILRKLARKLAFAGSEVTG
jgi:RNA polymerase sigma-70 factor (ECF subfamily)